jgi:predicted porin
MKKTLVAIAALAAFGAQAQSAVTLSGVYDVGYQAVNVDKSGIAKWSGIANNGVSTSAFFFKGQEDLGGGVSAIFLSELDFNAQISNTANQNSTTASFSGAVYNGTPFNGEQYVGLQSAKLGSLKIGTPNSPALDTSSTSQPFGTALGSGYSSSFGRLGTGTTSGLIQYVGAEGATGRIIRSEKAAVYTSPVFSGVTAQIEYSQQNDRGGYTANDNGVLGLSAKYNQGPLNAQVYSGKASAGSVAAAGSDTIAKLAGNTTAGSATTAAYFTANPLEANASTKWNMLGANYTVGATTAYVGYTTTKTDGMTTAKAIEDNKSWNLGAKYVMGNIDLLANYLVRTSNLTEAQAFSTSNGQYNPKAKLVGLGANYNLSKNSSVYYRYESISGLNAAATTQTALTNGVAGVGNYGDAKQTKQMVGIRMAF